MLARPSRSRWMKNTWARSAPRSCSCMAKPLPLRFATACAPATLRSELQSNTWLQSVASARLRATSQKLNPLAAAPQRGPPQTFIAPCRSSRRSTLRSLGSTLMTSWTASWRTEMGLAHAQRQQLLARNLPDSNKVRTTLGDYLSRTSLHPQDFARGIGYSYTTVRTFIANTYHGVASDDSALRAAILDFIERNPIARSTPVQGKLHETENVRLIRRYFYEALESRSAYYFRGAPGCQKSFVLEHLVAELNESEISTSGHGRRAYYIYCREGIKPTDLLKRVAEAAGAISAGKIDRILRNLRS